MVISGWSNVGMHSNGFCSAAGPIFRLVEQLGTPSRIATTRRALSRLYQKHTGVASEVIDRLPSHIARAKRK